MFVDKDSIIINGVSMGNYILEVNYGYHKMWGSDTGRNTLSGDFSGTFKGIYPKITLQFRKLKRSEIELLAPIFDSPYQNTLYYDPVKKTKITIRTYSNDWELRNKSFVDEARKGEAFSWAVISTKKRV